MGYIATNNRLQASGSLVVPHYKHKVNKEMEQRFWMMGTGKKGMSSEPHKDV